MTEQALIDLLTGLLVERWVLSSQTAEAVGRLVAEVARLQARDALADFLGRVAHTRAGAALAIAAGSGEDIRAAARRLKCSHGALAELVEEYRAALTERENGQDTLGGA